MSVGKRVVPTNGEDELMVELFGNDPQKHGETEGRHPETHDPCTPKEKMEGLQCVLETTFFVHPSRDFKPKHVGCVNDRPDAPCLLSHAYPVSMRNHPYSNRQLTSHPSVGALTTPPIQPTRMCRGKKPIRAPIRK